jgi:type II secretory pathway pseudopilin PulG
MLVVISIAGGLLAIGLSLSGKSGDRARRDALERFAAMIEQARSTAITRRKTVVLAIAGPDEEHGATRLGLFEVDRPPRTGEPLEGRPLQRWSPLPDGVAFASGEIAGLANPLDAAPLELRWQDGERSATVHSLAFTPRGGLAWPAGSKPVALTLGSGALRIGRAVARPWKFDG